MKLQSSTLTKNLLFVFWTGGQAILQAILFVWQWSIAHLYKALFCWARPSKQTWMGYQTIGASPKHHPLWKAPHFSYVTAPWCTNKEMLYHRFIGLERYALYYTRGVHIRPHSWLQKNGTIIDPKIFLISGYSTLYYD